MNSTQILSRLFAVLTVIITACSAQLYKPLKCYVCVHADGAHDGAPYNPDGLLKSFPSRPGFDFSKFVPHKFSQRCSEIYQIDPRYLSGRQWTGAPIQSYWPQFETECETAYDGLVMKGFCMKKELYVGNNKMIIRYCQPFLDGMCPYDTWDRESQTTCCKDRPRCNRSSSLPSAINWLMVITCSLISLLTLKSRTDF
ncbi:uncharacterized protein LOC141905398 isoform X2 [Tubulanus polymorphus]|uniref:uncharacterized protein LOC141905398 isoform X2 n=1 Tax=Tubulanus polymorphus TaxID=672921 RepID=UPI003DA4A036